MEENQVILYFISFLAVAPSAMMVGHQHRHAVPQILVGRPYAQQHNKDDESVCCSMQANDSISLP